MDFKRNATAQRDIDRWNEMQEKARKEEEYYDKLREEGSKAKKNTSNVAYDILTLQYNQDEVGLNQKYADDMVRYRAAVRSNQLVINGDTRAGYNIISGDPREKLRNPDPVPRPMAFTKSELSSARRPY
eukprot:gene7788-5602_t